MKSAISLKLLLDEMLQGNIVVDIILLCETFLNQKSVQLVNPPSYKYYYKNRNNRPGGGVLIFVKNNIPVIKELDTLFNNVTESLFLKVKVGSRIYCIGELYRIPNSSLKLMTTSQYWVWSLPLRMLLLVQIKTWIC